jgi:hypothetical protein
MQFGSIWLPDLLLMGTFFQDPANNKFTLWFLDVLAANLVLMTAIFWLMHRGRRLAGTSTLQRSRETFTLDFCLLLGGLGLAYAQAELNWANSELGQGNVAPFKWFWMLALGLAIHSATRVSQKVVLSVVVTVITAFAVFNPESSQHALHHTNAFFCAAALLCIWLDRVSVPRWTSRPIMQIAAASLFIYIVNAAVINLVMPKLALPSWWPLEVAAAVLCGIAAKALWDRSGHGLTRAVAWVRKRDDGAQTAYPQVHSQ